DYVGTTGVVTIPAGSTTATITVAITDDHFAEGSENFFVNLSNPTNATITDAQGQGTIIDEPDVNANDTVNITLVGDSAVFEGGVAGYTVIVDKAPLTDLIVEVVTGHITTNNGDLVPVTQNITILAGTLSTTFTVTNNDDNLVEGNESYEVTLTGNTIGGSVEAVSVDTTAVETVIIDNDTAPINPNISINDMTVNESAGTMTFTVSLSSVGTQPVQVDFSTADGSAAGADYTAQVGSLTIPVGATSTTITIAINDDSIVEGTEHYFVNLSNAVNGTIVDNQGIGTILDNDLIITNGNINAFISEEGLMNGLIDTIGENSGDDTTDSPVHTGDMSFNAPVGQNITGVTLSEPMELITSNGQAIVWTGVGTDTLVGSANGTTIITVNVDNTGSYTVTLTGAVDHPHNSVEDILSINSTVTVTTSGGVSESTNMAIRIEDDMPTLSDPRQEGGIAEKTTNLMITLDISGSMGINSGMNDLTRLDAAKDAIRTLIANYESEGELAVRIVTFSTSANPAGAVWMNATDAIAYIDGLSQGGWTDYDAALADTMVAYNDPGKIVDATNTVSYFFSDGQPTSGDGSVTTLTDSNSYINGVDNGIQTAEEQIWTQFLDANSVNSFAIGMGTGLGSNAMTILDPIAYNGSGVGGTTAPLIVTDFSQLSDVLAGTFAVIVQGNLMTSSDSTINVDTGMGADGGHVSEITIDGTTYFFDGTNVTVSGTNNSTFNSSTNVLTISTVQNSTLSINLNDGNYTLLGNPGLTNNYEEVINYSVVDNDGDGASSLVSILIQRADTAITITDEMAQEGDNLVHTVTLSYSSSIAQVFSFHLDGQTATEGVDFNGIPSFSDGVIYNTVNNTITVPVGVESFTFTVSTNVDYDVEPVETYTVEIGGVIATGAILNNSSGLMAVDDTVVTTVFATETLVNGTTSGSQSQSSVSSLEHGGYVVSWQSGSQIYTQRYDVNNNPLGSEQLVTSSGHTSQVVGLTNGNYLVTWSQEMGGGTTNIVGQLYTECGTPINGHFVVAQADYDPLIALPNGEFIVTWTANARLNNNGHDHDGSEQGVFGQRYDANGATIGNAFQINNYTSSSQMDSEATMLANGNFIVTWQSQGQDGSGFGVYSQQFSLTTTGVTKVGAETLVNQITAGQQFDSDVTALSNGSYVVTWTGTDDSSQGIRARMFNDDGTPAGSEFVVNSYTHNIQSVSSVAETSNGFVVVWQSIAHGDDDSVSGVYSQLFDSVGNKVGGEILINTHTDNQQTDPLVTSLADGGYVVTWSSMTQDGSGWGVYSQRFDALGNHWSQVSEGMLVRNDGELIIGANVLLDNDSVASTGTLSIVSVQSAPHGTVTLNADGTITFVPNASYVGMTTFEYTITDGNGNHDSAIVSVLVEDSTATCDLAASTLMDNVLYGTNADVITGANLAITGETDEFQILGNNVMGVNFDGTEDLLDISKLINGGEKVNPNTLSDYVEVSLVDADNDGQVDDTLIVVDSNGESDSGGMLTNIYLQDTQLTESQINFVANVDPGSTSSVHAVDDSVLNQLASAELQVNTATLAHQSSSSIASTADGGYVVSWTSPDDGFQSFGVYTQRYDAYNSRVGVETRVNEFETNNQDSSHIIGLENGNYLVTWSSHDTDFSNYTGNGNYTGVVQNAGTETILSQLYSSDGVAIGNNFVVALGEYDPIAPMPGGGFVVTWTAGSTGTPSDSDGNGVFGQRYDENANPMGAAFQINTEEASDQQNTELTALSNNDFVVTWQSMDQDNSGNFAIYSQLFTLTLTGVQAVGSETLVSSASGTYEIDSDVTSLANGTYVVTWTIDDGSSNGIAARIYNNDGTPVGNEFIVNDYITGSQEKPVIAETSNGFVVVWQSVAHGQELSGTGIYSQLFDLSGNKIGDEVIVNSYTLNNQEEPAVSSMADGGYVVSWGSQSQDGSGSGIYSQRFDMDGVPWKHIVEGYLVSNDGELVIGSNVLLANDSSDIGLSIGVSSVQDAQNGTVTLNADGTITFEPIFGYVGPASFEYTIVDANGVSDTAEVKVFVQDASSDTVSDNMLYGADGDILIGSDYVTDGQDDQFEILGDGVLISNFDISEDVLGISELIGSGEAIDSTTLSDYLEITFVDADNDGQVDDTQIVVDSNGESDTGGELITIFIQDEQLTLSDFDDDNLDYD
ncbi:MAG: cadherin-like domain-containing protein, partial [Methanosarcinales archaeon]|nr:cadherin-like domain-containing protein [Methanosarcinales archaeon]